MKYGLLNWPIITHVLTKKYNKTVNSEWAKKKMLFFICKPGRLTYDSRQKLFRKWRSVLGIINSPATLGDDRKGCFSVTFCWHDLVEKVPGNSTFYYNSLHPNISKDILHTVLYTFSMLLTRRICLTIKSFFSWWSFYLFSWPKIFYSGVDIVRRN